MTGQTVVLGWDGLDYELVDEFGLHEEFGPHTTEIETFDNPYHEKPHTFELWPSIITGVRPEEHGVWSQTEEGVSWDNPVIDWASEVAQGIVPKSVRTEIGKILRDRGAEITQHGVDYYEDIGTLFDGRKSKPVSIPNYVTERDEEMGLKVERGELWQKAIKKASVGGDVSGYRMMTDLHKMDELVMSHMMEKIGITLSAMQWDYDIVFVWLPYIDSVGHLTPTVEEGGWQRRHYHNAARATALVRDHLTEGDDLFCLADHGLQDGEHSHSTFFGGTDEAVVEEVDSVLDVRAGLDSVTPRSSGDLSLREAHTFEGTSVTSGMDTVAENLEDLGYI